MKKILLGSQSPRRQEILRFFHLPFEVKSSSFNESSIPYQQNPEDYVKALARGKGRALQPLYPDHAIITADTIVIFDHQILHKPKGPEEAALMLKTLSGQTHTVYSGVSVCLGQTTYTDVEKTAVRFNPLTDKQIDRYVHSGHGKDKAGSYGVQETGSLLIQSIEGCFYNVMGLPVNTLSRLLNQLGINLWDTVSN